MSVKVNRSKVDYWLTEEGLFLISCWGRDGLTQKDMYERMGVTAKTFSDWKAKFPELRKALIHGMESANYAVENALFKSAIGYKTTEVKTITSSMPDSNGNRQSRIERIEKEHAPNTTACLAWLNNRNPKEWRRNRDTFIQDEVPNNSSINITIKRAGQDDFEITNESENDLSDWDDWDEEE